MIKPKAVVFLLLSAMFASVHLLAVKAALYWFYWWFDIFMHFWGGILIVLGTHVFYSFFFKETKPSLMMVLFSLMIVAGAWEVFEWFAGLYDPATYLIDTVKDVVVGFCGGLLAHFVLSRYTMK